MLPREAWITVQKKIVNLICFAGKKFLLCLESFFSTLFLFSFFLWNDKMVKWHDWGHILSCLIHVLHNTFYNNKKAHAIIMKAKRGGGRRIETWKTHVLNKNKCVYIMQRFVIKNFNVMLQQFFPRYSNIIILMVFFSFLLLHPIRKQDFTLDFYFRQFWTDPRLAYRKRPGVEQLSVGSDFVKSIWVPDTFFVNEKQSYFHIATTSNEFIRVHHSGSITRSMR